MTVVFLSDLDDTLFQTLRKCPDDAQGLKVMSTLVDGSPSGYATPRQQTLLAWLSSGSLIPVTARSKEVLARVDVPQAPAICSNGGCIIESGGGFDRQWHDLLMEEARGGDPVSDVHRELTSSLNAEDFRHWIVAENSLPLYVVVKSNTGRPDDLLEFAQRHGDRLPPKWRRHLNGNNLAFLPPWLNKRHAVAYLIERIRSSQPETAVVGIGDSLSDVGFMDLCDFAMSPTSSQFWRSATLDNAWLK
ncbi:sucrose-6-phosphate hydrolase [Sphingomonas sp. R86521]|uniref:sucrose-6-phosphate hydrolase n=1 Tax=Sphingomonas sp. R86521 TaxID=3093860 RepID=UPI0036D421D9